VKNEEEENAMTDMLMNPAVVRAQQCSQVAQGQGLALAQAAKRLPPSRSGRPVSADTIARWIQVGLRAPDGRRVRLHAVRLGGRWVVTEDAIKEFLEQLTLTRPEAEEAVAPAPGPPSARAARPGRRAARAEAQEEPAGRDV
jgi:hypothetical protein